MKTDSSPETVLDAAGLANAIGELATGVAKLIGDPERAALVGIHTRGATLARRIHAQLAENQGWDLPLGFLDITLYRDDLSRLAENPLVRRTDLDFDLEGKVIVLLDDVLYTGRTIRSALDAIIDYGRPEVIRLAVLIDRGGREFPIQPDFASLTVDTAPGQIVKVHLTENDEQDEVVLEIRPPGPAD